MNKNGIYSLALFQIGNSHEYRETITPRPQSIGLLAGADGRAECHSHRAPIMLEPIGCE
ncbi:conserved hypothetical protein [Vibrio crassostreae]|nr:conserved hypothetical protein [Vibrio crassostreae]CAK2962091.1 conserved hypothetical protein [Vibrio crassostreae]CAK2964074.1 conserved hypothetical protein [Vibrio crassostreae]CAK3487649.1 conserved hypothetical protein [Vibrio crassostreae]CAK3564148.1 conserved hypothetical protein [Vibrio crassostreae]